MEKIDKIVVPFDDLTMVCRASYLVDLKIVFNDSTGRTIVTKIHSIAFNRPDMSVTICHGLGFTTVKTMEDLDDIKVVNNNEATSLRKMFDLYDIAW